jgi:ATP-dependent protease HslVU (ClpYQ) peptidase subunit
MSTIVVVRKGDQGCIAADSLTCFGETKLSSAYDRADDKIHRLGQSYMGIVGSAAHHMVTRSLLLEDTDAYRFDGRMGIFETFRRLHPLLKERYFLNPKDQDDDPYESSHMDALIVNPSGVFGVFALREVFEYARFWAIGSGADFALGAMYAAYERLDDARAIARLGVEAGAEFNSATALPLTLYSVAMSADSGA